MKPYLLFLTAVLLAACSKGPEQDPPPVEKKPVAGLYGLNLFVDDDYAEHPLDSGDQYQVFLAYDASLQELFSKDTYITYQMLSGKPLQFSVGIWKCHKADTLSNVKGNKYYYFHLEELEWVYTSIAEHDFCRMFFIEIPEEGEYEFRLKFEQPDEDNTFYSSRYRLDVKYVPIKDPEALVPYAYVGDLTKIDE